MSYEYETVIGLEVHCELSTRTKIFCGCSTEFGGAPNTHVCPVCAGMPGTLPVLNRKVVEYALAACLALNCDITQHCKFDRKNYFYPDLPKAYQISQLYLPIGRNGHVDIECEGYEKSIGIHEIHMEEDAGKLIHDKWEDCTVIDYNRCGVPLIEIVSEPDMSSADEVIAYLEKLRRTLQYLGVSDCRMQEGSIRADINLSVRRRGEEKLGTRTEMKNMNSFKAITRAIQAETDRQIEVLEDGKRVTQETRRWDDSKCASYAMRSKEDAQDYRYFPDPDLPPVFISDDWIARVKALEPEFREDKCRRYVSEYGISEQDALVLTDSVRMADIFEETAKICKDPKEAANWLMVEAMRIVKARETDPSQMNFSPRHLAELIALVDAGTINRAAAREIFEKIFDEDIEPESYAQEHGMKIESDSAGLEKVIGEVITANPKSVEDYRAGKKKAVGFLVGQTMKAMNGRADPGTVNKMIVKMLDEER